MPMDPAVRRETEVFAASSFDWLWTANHEATVTHELDLASFTEAADFPDGFIPAGKLLGAVTATPGLVAKHPGTTDEVQTLTVGGAGLTSFTITFSGQTTDAIPAAATAAQVQAALEALSNIGVGDVAVSGAAGGPWTVAFIGALANTNVAAMTTTPTGGTGTVTVATTVAGGADAGTGGVETAYGVLMADTTVHAGSTRVQVPVLIKDAILILSRLPLSVRGAYDAAARTELAARNVTFLPE